MSVHVVYETHSTTTDNEAGIATGWLPGELSATGRRQAAELGERRRGDGIDAVFVSDLRRAVETAEIAFAGTALPVRQDVRLRECDYGELNGHPMSAVAPLRRHHLDERFMGGQSYREILATTDGFLRDLAATWDGARVLLIAHHATRWALDCLLAGAEPEAALDAPARWRPGWHYVIPAE